MRYQIWNKKSSVITPSMEVFSPEDWMARYPIAKLEGAKLVISGGYINGAFCGEFNTMKEQYLRAGCDFTDCKTDADCLAVIEAFEDLQSMTVNDTPSNEDIIASSLAYLAMTASVNQ